MTLKVWVHVASGDCSDPQRVCWYMGTSDRMVENAMRMHLHLPRHARFLLRDMDGDLVPVSATLPHDHTFQLVLVDDGHASSHDSVVNTTSTVSGDSQPQRPRHKRRRTEKRVAVASIANIHEDSISIGEVTETRDHQSLSSDTTTLSAVAHPPTTPHRPRSMVYLVTRFLETFTCAISNDDNISFIPNTGPYALYALYCHLFPDTTYHPKSPNGFYKMTSMQGKIDRQRVIRYYQHSVGRPTNDSNDSSSGDGGANDFLANSPDPPHQYVVCKPEGKGPLLRKYIDVGADVSAADLARAASFVHALDLNPHAVVAQYTRFLIGFSPISKATYQAHTKPADLHPPHID